MESGLVSVVIATYNRSNVLPYAIGSALDQTYQEIRQILVIGDGCTDDGSGLSRQSMTFAYGRSVWPRTLDISPRQTISVCAKPRANL